jgi:hypothetical protein
MILGAPRRFLAHIDHRFIERCAGGACSVQSDPSSTIINTKALEDAMAPTLGAIETDN